MKQRIGSLKRLTRLINSYPNKPKEEGSRPKLIKLEVKGRYHNKYQ
jgi:hypothetical protein